MVAKKKSAPVAAKKVKEMLLVQSKVKEYVRSLDKQCGSDLVEVLNERVAELLERAARRAEANGRRTARACDV